MPIDDLFRGAWLVKAAPHCRVTFAQARCAIAARQVWTVRCAVLLNAMLGAVEPDGRHVPGEGSAVDESVFESAPSTKVSASGDGIAQAGELGAASCQGGFGRCWQGGADVALFVECDLCRLG